MSIESSPPQDNHPDIKAQLHAGSTDLFEELEKSMANIEIPEFPDDGLEEYITKAIDPIAGAQFIQRYVESQSPDAQEHIIDKYIHELNYHFMARYMNLPTNLVVGDIEELLDFPQALEIHELLIDLNDHHEVRVGGRMHYFEKHYYWNEATNIRRPIVSIRLHSGGFIRLQDGEEQIVRLDNYVTLPVTAIVDYKIKDEELG